LIRAITIEQCRSWLHFLALVKKEKPQVVLLLGPFLDVNNTDIASGDIFYDKPSGEKGATTRHYLSHEDLFSDLIAMIAREISGCPNTKVVMVPSHKDIHHIEPLPQNPYSGGFFGS
jgi:hypothetical protein